jgi:hypothetical protein
MKALGGIVGFCLGFFYITLVFAQNHKHPPEHAQLHEQFYASWNKPNVRSPSGERTMSCCSKMDCYPAQIRKRGTQFEVLRREDQVWVPVPADLMEHNQPDPRESPDGRAHVCMGSPYNWQQGQLYCIVMGNGT